MEKILVIGASGHAKVVVEAIELNKEYEVYGFIDSYKPIGEIVLGYEILGTEEILLELSKQGVTRGVIAIGDNWIRSLIYNKIISIVPDFEFVSIIHPSAIVSPYTTIGKGTVVLASGTINTHAVVGDFCIINTNANFGHDGVMEDFSSLAPGVTVGGTVFIGRFAAISLGVVIIQNLSIGQHSVVGAGAVVTVNIDEFTIAYGVPARAIRNRKKGESYLNSVPLDIHFKVYKIRSKNDLEEYKKHLSVIHNSNPFYKTELLDTTDMNIHQLCYFVLERSDSPIIIMPFYKREITVNGKRTEFKDVISPYGYSGPLFDAGQVNEKDLKHFWKQVDIWYKKKNVISEFVRFSLNENHLGYTGILQASLKNIKGRIINKDTQWEKFKSKVRNNHRKGLQEELELKIYKHPISDHIVKDFYDIYIQTMERNNARSQYFHYIDYFRSFIQNNPDSFVIAMIYKDEIPISTELVLIENNILYSYLGGTLSDYFFTRPNDFLKIEVMNWARDNGFEHYVLGGGRVDYDGLYKYKKSFFPNDDDVTYYTGRKIINKEVYAELVSEKCEMEIEEYQDSENLFFPLYRINE